MVFVTGATGLLGSHLLYFLAVSGHSVSALRRKQSRLEDSRAVFLQYPDGERYWNTINWVEGDVVQKEGLAEYVRRADYVYHCAAVVSFSGTDRMHLMNTNLQGTENVAALCLEYQVRLCYVSSIAALGDARQPEDLIDEDTPVIAGREHSVYSQSKTAAEKLIRKYIGYGLNAVIVCPSVILGAGMWHRSSARLFFTAAKGIPFYTRGMTGYVDVRDVCGLMIRLCEDPLVSGERFVLNGGNYTYQELFTAIARVNGVQPPWWNLAPWMTELVWRMLACWGYLSGSKPAFTRETARSSQHCSRYSNARILSLYPDFHFYPLAETVDHMRLMWISASADPKHK